MRKFFVYFITCVLVFSVMASGCMRYSIIEKIKLNDLISYIDKNSEISTDIELGGWAYYQNYDEPNHADRVNLYYYGSSCLKDFDVIRVTVNEYLSNNPDSFLNNCIISIYFSYDRFLPNSGMAPNFIAIASNLFFSYREIEFENEETPYLKYFKIGEGTRIAEARGENPIRISDMRDFEPSIKYLMIETDLIYDDSSFLSTWDTLEGIFVRTGDAEESSNIQESLRAECNL